MRLKLTYIGYSESRCKLPIQAERLFHDFDASTQTIRTNFTMASRLTFPGLSVIMFIKFYNLLKIVSIWCKNCGALSEQIIQYLAVGSLSFELSISLLCRAMITVQTNRGVIVMIHFTGLYRYIGRLSVLRISNCTDESTHGMVGHTNKPVCTVHTGLPSDWYVPLSILGSIPWYGKPWLL